MDAVNDPSCEDVVVMSSAQVGKTEILNNIIGYHIAHDPCPILLIQPTLEMAEAWSKDRLAPMLRDSPDLTGKVKDPQARNSGNTVRHKVFPGGHITMAGANSPASLASRPIRVLLGDERDRWPVSAGTEGSPWNLGSKRTTTFWNRKRVQVSTPTIKGASAIEDAFNGSTQEHFHVPCPHCGGTQRLRWKNVKWEDQDPGTARYQCEICDEPWTDHERWEALSDGEWIAEHPERRVRGFHLNELYSPWVMVQEMVEAFFEAKGNKETLKTWVNTALGETFNESSDHVDHEILMRRTENWPELPQRALLLTAGVDVQKDRLELEIVAWAKDMESWSVHYEQLFGDPHEKDVWERLDQSLALKFRHESGNELGVSAACVDSGGHHTDEVYLYCKPRWSRRVYCIRGQGGPGLPTVVRSSRNNRRKVRLFTLGVDGIKSHVYSRLETAAEGPGYSHFPLDRTEQYFLGLTSERQVTKYVRGKATVAWVQAPGTANEPLDLRVYATAAVEILNPKWAAYERALAPAEDPDDDDPDEAPEPKRRTKRRGRGRGWATSWRP